MWRLTIYHSGRSSPQKEELFSLKSCSAYLARQGLLEGSNDPRFSEGERIGEYWAFGDGWHASARLEPLKED